MQQENSASSPTRVSDPTKVTVVVEDVEVGYMGCAANKIRSVTANSSVSALRALASDPPMLPRRLRRASVRRKRTQQANPNEKRMEGERSQTELCRVRGSL